MSDLIERLPCPFCGSYESSIKEGSTFRWRVVECSDCGAQCGESRAKTIGEADTEGDERAATNEWNMRAIDSQAADRITELEKQLADWQRRSESCESKVGQLEANELVADLRQQLAERDALIERMSEAGRGMFGPTKTLKEDRWGILDAALSLTPPQALADHDAEVRRKVLEEAAKPHPNVCTHVNALAFQIVIS